MNYGWQVGSPTPVGVYPLGNSSLGIADLAGNVREWCQDGGSGYGVQLTNPSIGTAVEVLRVVRGGSWKSDASNCRSSARSFISAEYRDHDVGFRAVRIDGFTVDGYGSTQATASERRAFDFMIDNQCPTRR